MMALSPPFREDCLVLPVSAFLLQVIGARRQCLKLLRSSEKQATCEGCFPVGVSALWQITSEYNSLTRTCLQAAVHHVAGLLCFCELSGGAVFRMAVFG